ncbi:D(2) dopamine receptor [Folsomia candida]|uniref:D(2) dopamine receptor n=1 Tax=Folsomia candida TaxID=158441 RepID=A0A226E4D2_FOLCA|nr:D(2) dopamine receptor [Folsomia candida]
MDDNDDDELDGLWIALDILLCTASILSLCAISIDRYLAITRPLAYSRRRRSKRLALSMISCVWVAAAIITSPPILGCKVTCSRILPTPGFGQHPHVPIDFHD